MAYPVASPIDTSWSVPSHTIPGHEMACTFNIVLHTQTNLTDIDSELQALQSGDKRKSDTSATSDEGASMTTASTSNE